MKDLNDVQTRFKDELTQWFNKQIRNPYEDYHLYFLASTPEHNGGLLICLDTPPNPEYQLADGQRIRKDLTIEQNMLFFNDTLRRLPVLTI